MELKCPYCWSDGFDIAVDIDEMKDHVNEEHWLTIPNVVKDIEPLVEAWKVLGLYEEVADRDA